MFSVNNYMCISRAQTCFAALAVMIATVPGMIQSPAYAADDRFAAAVVSVTGNFNESLYRSPASLLGKPTTYIRDAFPAPGGQRNGTVAASAVFAPYNTAPDGTKLITTLDTNEQITVRFDTPIVRDPNHWYGMDFTVYGNAFFGSDGFVYANTNMEQRRISGGGIFNEPTQVSVSPDNINWYTYATGPFGDDYYPTNPFAWDRVNDTWGAELDWTKPVNPTLTASSFSGLSVADAIDLYAGSAGGTSFSLAETGFSSISYIRVTGIGNAGEIDGFSRVGFAGAVAAVVPEPGTIALLLFAAAGGLIHGRICSKRAS
ncbi:MAG: PEP-CTERM sorting domain-containing protein [Fibrella sp.]|nr:PEP-CTERM sorting domain-containing protein [Armatimonadota bacterium]